MQMTAVKSGNFSDSDVWGGSVPDASDIAIIPEGCAIRLDNQADCRELVLIGSLAIIGGGELRVGYLLIAATGVLQLNGHATVTIRDIAPEAVTQRRTGIISSGSLRAIGDDKTPYAWTPHTVPASASSMSLAQTGWQVADEVVILSTAAKPWNKGNKAARKAQFGRSHKTRIANIGFGKIDIDEPMPIEAPAYYPAGKSFESGVPVANLTRSCVIRSENPAGHRGHIMIMDGAVDLFNCELRDLGRTSADRMIDPSTNVPGRYPIHVHRNANVKFNMTRCVVNGFDKWGITLHEASNARVHECVVVDGVGAGIVTERGNEENCAITNCLIGMIRGGYQFEDKRAGVKTLPRHLRGVMDIDGRADIASDGSGIWCRSSGTDIRGNTIADCAGYAININGYYRDTSIKTLLPKPIRNNTAIGCFGGFWATYAQHFGTKNLKKNKRFLVDGFWMFGITQAAISAYHDAFLDFNNVHVFNTEEHAAANRGSKWGAISYKSAFFISKRNYETVEFTFHDCSADGVNLGFELANPMGRFVSSWLTLDDCQVRAYVVWYAFDSSYLANRTINNCDFQADGFVAAQVERSPIPYIEFVENV